MIFVFFVFLGIREYQCFDLVLNNVHSSEYSEVLLSKNVTHKKCLDYHEETNYSTVCDYVTNKNCDCVFENGYFQYMHFVYCSLPHQYYAVLYIAIFLWMIFLFVALGVTAEEFFCPCLKTISKTLHMSDSVAGVTLLALGNGAPDIFSVVAAIDNDDPETTSLAFQELFGAGIFVTTFVAGFINIYASFRLARRPFLRDVIFYIAAVGWTFAVMYKRDIRTKEAIGFIVLYGVYVLIVIFGQIVNRYVRKRAPSFRRLITVEDVDSQNSTTPVARVIQDLTESADFTSYNYSSDHAHMFIHNVYNDRPRPNDLLPQVPIDINSHIQIVNTDLTDLDCGAMLLQEKLYTPIFERLTGINSINWKYSSILSKLFSVLKVPIIFILSITCPVVDQDMKGERWNKWLNLILCLSAPLFAIFSLDKATVSIYRLFNLWRLILIIGLVLLVMLHATSSVHSPPKFHFVLAFVGFVIAVLWIKAIAQEIVNILQALGWIFKLSFGIMGLTFLAWGNSIGDFISNLTMARNGAPRMAIAACYGGPLLNMLLGVGISCTVSAISNNGDKKLIRSSTQYVLSGTFLSLSLFSALIIFPLKKFISSTGLLRKY